MTNHVLWLAVAFGSVFGGLILVVTFLMLWDSIRRGIRSMLSAQKEREKKHRERALGSMRKATRAARET